MAFAAAGALGLGLAGGAFGGGSNKQRMSNLSPAGGALGALFGQGFSRKGGWMPTRSGVQNTLDANFLGTPFASVPQLISQYGADTLAGSPLEDSLFNQLFNTDFLTNQFGSAMDNVNFATDQAREGAATGFAVDPMPLFNEAIRQLNTHVLPQLAETSGLGLQSSGFQALSGQAASDLLGQAAVRGTELADSAAQRRLLSIPALSQAAAGGLALPTSFASDALGLANQFRGQSLGPVQLFAQLAGLGNNLPYLQEGNPTQDSTSDLIGALGSTLPFLIGML